MENLFVRRFICKRFGLSLKGMNILYTTILVIDHRYWYSSGGSDFNCGFTHYSSR